MLRVESKKKERKREREIEIERRERERERERMESIPVHWMGLAISFSIHSSGSRPISR